MDYIHNNKVVLMVDDDPDDLFLAKDAFSQSDLPGDFQMVSGGEEMMDYLYRRGRFIDLENFPMPSFILLDLNMPGKSGFESLMEIKKDPSLRRIPIVVFTTSGEEEDIYCSYELGASSYITKPATFDDFVEVMKKLGEYWLSLVRLPEKLAGNWS